MNPPTISDQADAERAASGDSSAGLSKTPRPVPTGDSPPPSRSPRRIHTRATAGLARAGSLIVAHQRQIRHRFLQAVNVGIWAFSFTAINSLLFLYQQYEAIKAHNAVAIEWANFLTMASVVLGLIWIKRLSTHSQHVLAIRVFFVILPAGLLLSTYINGGFAQTAIMAFPIVIVMAAFFGNRQILIWVTAAFAAGVLAMYVAGLFGIKQVYAYRESLDPNIMFHLHEAIYVWVVIVGTFFIVAAIVGDFGGMMLKLRDENKKVRGYSRMYEGMAMRDQLTQLNNRHYCEQYFERLAEGGEISAQAVTLFFLDIDNFKHINTQFGHLGGDKVLTETAVRLTRLSREFDCELARIGGDEFVLWNSANDQLDEPQFLNRALADLAKPIEVGGDWVRISCSVGVAQQGGEQGDFLSLFRDADIAMRQAKKAGKARYAYFDQVTSEQVLREIDINNALRNAVIRDEFLLNYQAQVDFRAQKIIAAEALIRWNKPDEGLVPPNEFIAIAEQSGVIVDITRWVLRKACQDCYAWQSRGRAGVSVSVNISANMFELADMDEEVAAALEVSGLAPELLELELTETLTMVENDRLKTVLGKIKARGVSLAIDDFGTGYSNLSSLVWVQLDKLKVDQKFVRHLDKSEANQAIVPAIVEMANSLGLKVIVEGVETQEVADALLAMHCRLGQGYFWSRPVDLEQFLRLKL